jgi:geranyl diphosphate synthase
MYAEGVETPSYEATHKVVKQFNVNALQIVNDSKSVVNRNNNCMKGIRGIEPQQGSVICQPYLILSGAPLQIVDDVLDLTASSTMLGKPALNDLRSGMATAPVSLLISLMCNA